MAVTKPPRRDMWAVLVVDPVTWPIGRALARVPGVTPNRVTALSALAGLGAAACFATGLLRLGGVLFLLRYAFDVMDGVVARAQHSSSSRGAVYDVAADVAGIAICFAALSWHLIRTDEVASVVPVLLLAAVVFYNWILAYRKGMAAELDLGDGGARGDIGNRIPVLSGWFALAERLNMKPIPWAVEVETLALGLAPLALPTDLVWVGLLVALVFYVLADLMNFRRVLTLADTLAHRRQEAAS